MKKIKNILIILLILPQISQGQSEITKEVENRFNTIMEQRRNNKPYKGITNEELKSSDPKKNLSSLSRFDKDSDGSVRRLAFFYEVQLANTHRTDEIRQDVTKRLVKALVEPNSNVSPHPYTFLLSFEAKDFNDASKLIIRQALDKGNSTSGIIRICGVANIKEELPRLKELMIDEKNDMNEPNIKNTTIWYRTTSWNARLARARMGIKEDIEMCIKLLDSEIVKNPEMIHFMLEDVGFIRQPEAINCLKKYLDSNIRLASTNPAWEGELAAGYLIDILADSLADFPVKKEPGRGYSLDKINAARKWMSEQKEWKIIR